jgi:molybdenum storage protein
VSFDLSSSSAQVPLPNFIATLLYPWGGIKIGHDEIVKLPTYLAEGCIPVMHGMPPYDYFAIPPNLGVFPFTAQM